MFRRFSKELSWIQLGWVRSSFLSKALAAIGLAAGVLTGNADAIENAGFDVIWSGSVFWGSITFLAGYLYFALRVPVEFRRAGEIDEIVGRMSGLTNWLFFESRRTLARRLLEKEQNRCWLRAPADAIRFLENRLAEAEKLHQKNAWSKAAPGLYQADLNLRQFSEPISRFLVALLFAVGIVLVVLPTLHVIAKALGIL